MSWYAQETHAIVEEILKKIKTLSQKENDMSGVVKITDDVYLNPEYLVSINISDYYSDTSADLKRLYIVLKHGTREIYCSTKILPTILNRLGVKQ